MKRSLLLITGFCFLANLAVSQTITVTSPNGGEDWAGCSSHLITWTASGTSGNYHVVYSTNGGSTWASVTSFYSGTSFNWTIPNVSSANCLIKVYDSNTPTTQDVSNAVFTITAPIEVTSPNGGEIWKGLTVETITWDDAGTSNQFDIEYSTDAGIGWNMIADNYSTTLGQYNWSVPNNPSTTVLVRITDRYNACMTDNSNNLFTIDSADYKVTQPNGGETWYPNTSYNITWTAASYLTANVKIEYSTDGGSSWTTIIASTLNDGIYSWSVPNDPSPNALVRISEVGVPSHVDTSDAVFTMAPYIEVTSPNGGENYLGCNVETITWSTGGTSDNFTIVYSTDGGSTWNNIVTNYTTSLEFASYNWTVNNVGSSNCLIRIYDTFDNGKSDTSDASFTINATTKVIVNTANGGETWDIGRYYDITYILSGGVTNVALYYSTDSGSTWTLIDGNETSGTYSWKVPDFPSTNALIKIQDIYNTCNFDISNAVFTMNEHITVTSPDGAEILSGCESHTITWINGGTSHYFDVEYSINGGSSWNAIVIDYYTTSTTPSYNWSVIPDVQSSNCLIRITDNNDGSRTDLSDAVFTINQSNNIVILTPNGGEAWQSEPPSGSGGSCSTNYYMSNTPVTASCGNFYDTGGPSGYYTNYQNYTKTFYPSTGGAKLEFTFTSFSTESCCDRLYIYDGTSTGAPLIGTYQGTTSPGTITATNVSGAITFRFYSDGSVTSQGWASTFIETNICTSYPITWAANNTSNYFDIYYSTDSGSTWTNIEMDYYTTSYTYNWCVPNTPSDQCLIWITDNNNNCKTDTGDAVFEILQADQLVIDPDGGETFYAGTSQTILWADATYLTTNVVIEYSTDNGSTWYSVIASTPNDGSYLWTVVNEPSTQCRIKVSELGNPAQKDSSDAVFTILPHITVTAPNGAESLDGCLSQYITWSAGGNSYYYDIDYSTDNGATWINIITDYYTTATNASYNWSVIPNLTAANALVRVMDNNDNSKRDSSDAIFSINTTQYVTLTAPNGGETWVGGSTENITYTVSGPTTSVRLFYSIDSGITWTQITSSTSGGTYNWLVPNVPSTNYYVKVENNNNSCIVDSSNAVFTITATANELYLPNGGEDWIAGTNHNITWDNTTYLSGNVFIEYSYDAGVTWNTVIASTLNDGSYSWTVNNTHTIDALVRVSEEGNPSAYDFSDGVFTIAPKITVNYPNGGESFNGCQNVTLLWRTGATSTQFKIEYSIDMGATWITVISNYTTGVENATYNWVVPNGINSNYCLIRISDLFDPAEMDTSDAVFSITPTSYALITAPNGGEIWDIGYNYNITYNISGPTTNVKIEYSADSGSTWNLIDGNETSGIYSWKVPDAPSTNALIRIEDINNSCIWDQSNAVFTMRDHLTVTSPKGAETLTGCNSHTITWINGGTSHYFDIEYSTDGGASWNTIVSNYYTTATNATYNWSVIPNVATSNAFIRITDTNNGTYTDESDAAFTINQSNSIIILAPNGGEVYDGVTSVSPSCTSYNMSNTTVYASCGYFYDTGGPSSNYGYNQNYTKTFYPEIPGSKLKFTFSSFYTYNSSDRLLVYDGISTAAPLIGSYYGSTSIGPFTATNPDGALTFRFYSDGSYNVSGWSASFTCSSETITWAANGTSNYFDIKYSTDNGATWNNVITDYYTTGYTYPWCVPNDPSTQVLIQINDNNNSCKSDTSDAVFEIQKAAPILLIPNGGESYYAGTSQTITWRPATYLDINVLIEYSTNNGSTWNTIIASTPNDGSYSWTVNNTPSTQCLVRVSEATTTTENDVSDAVFIILPHITVTAPNGGENLAGCLSQTITWNAGGTSYYYDINYSTDGGSTWDNIVTNYYTTATSASYNWSVITNISSSNCLVRVSDNQDGAKTDTSNAVFTINSTQYVVVVAPNGGETWQGFDTQSINYSTSGPTTIVDIFYSLDNGVTWTQAANNTSGGTYNWTIPNSPATTALVRVVSYTNSCIADTSDAVFTIIAAPSVLLIPNGGEDWIAGTSHNITWTSSTYLTTNVTIEYSDDNGLSWITVIASTPNDGTYSWNVPNNPTTTALVRISEQGNPSAYDVSDAVFRIAPYIEVVIPNGGETYEGCEIVALQWRQGGTTNQFKIEYSTNNGGTWTTVIPNYNTGLENASYNWTVPNGLNSTNCLVRISDLFAPTKVDQSDAVFTISPTSNAIVNSPNGGEVWDIGYNYNILYTLSSPTTNVKIEYSTNNGSSWNLIDANETSGTYSWQVPDFLTTVALIRIEDINNSCIWDQSDAVFTMRDHITVTSPNGAEMLDGCESHTITWKNGGTSHYFDIEYTTDGGSTWNPIVIDYYTTNTNATYNWSVLPDVTTSNALIRITDNNNGSYTDQSDAAFTITGSMNILVLSPNGGEVWQATAPAVPSCASYNMSNTTVYASCGNFYDTGGPSGNYGYNQNYTKTFYPEIPGSMLKFTFSSFYTYNTSDRLLVYDGTSTAAPLIGSYYGSTSIGPFTATNPDGALTFRFYSDGSYNVSGWSASFSCSSEIITWASNNTSNYFDISYSTDGGATWTNIITDYYTTSYTYPWCVPNTPSDECLIQISDNNNTCKTDQSDALFEILRADPLILVPDGGEQWYGSTTESIDWVDPTFLDANVLIEYSLDNGILWDIVMASTTNDGQYTWSVTDDISSTQCLIRVSELSNTSVYDVSDAVFSISPSITITTPNGDSGSESWESCTATSIDWEHGGTSNYFDIDFSIDSGVTWTSIIIDYYDAVSPANYTWNIPNIPTTKCLVRVTDNNNGIKLDVSDSTFTITPSITITSPNYGEVIAVGTVHTITWDFDGTSDYYDIYYSTDGGASWTNIVFNFDTTQGAYNWTVPNDPSTNCLIRVTDNNNTCMTDDSDIPFTITNTPSSITITAPNGGETVTGCTTYDITWTETGTSDTYDIEYSLDGGVSWISIVSDTNITVPDLYTWNVPNITDSSVIVRVKDAVTSTNIDQSDQPFIITQSVTATITAGGPVTFCSGDSVQLTSGSATDNVWSTLETTQSIWVSTTGSYTVTVTTGGCSDISDPVNVTVNTLPATPVITPSGPVTFCDGGNVLLTSSSATGNTWDPTNETTQSINVTSTSSHFVTVTDGNGCQATSATTVVTVNPVPATPTITPGGPTTFCQGDSVSLTSSSASNNIWSPGSETTQVIYAKTSGSYTVTVDVGCTAVSSPEIVTVNINPTPSVSVSGATTFCTGDSVVLTSDYAIGNVWSPGNETNQAITVTSTGSYYTVVTDGNGCTGTSSTTGVTVLPVPPTPTITAGGPSTFCAGDSVVLTSSSAVDNVWSPGAETTQSITVTATGTYTVTVDNGSCSALSAPEPVTVNPLPIPTVTAGGPTTFCDGGSVALTASSSVGNVWKPNSETTQVLNVTTSGSYYVVETTGAGCTDSSAVTVVTVNPLPAVPTISAGGPTTFCQGDSVVLTSSSSTGNYWSPGAETTQSITTAVSGSYQVTVTDGNSCSSSSTSTIVIANPLPTPTISAGGPLTFCEGDSVVLTASAVSGNVWSPGSETTQSITVITSGSYYVVETDGNGCVDSSSAVTVTVNPLPTPTVTAGGPTTFCAGGSVMLTSSEASGNVWSPGSELTQSITANTSGSYYVIVSDGNGCTDSSTTTVVTINPLPSTPTITASGSTTICAGDSVTLTSSSPAGNFWSPGGETVDSIVVYNSGSYYVKVIDGNECSDSSLTTSVTVNPLPTLSAGGATTFCHGDSVVLSSSSPTGNNWSPGAETTQSITVSASGTYTLDVTDGNGCSITDSIIVTVNPLPSIPVITAGGLTNFCVGDSVQLTSSAAFGNTWSPGGETTQSIYVFTTGSYTVTETDGNGCSATSAATVVSVSPIPTVTVSGPVTFCAGDSVTLTSSNVTENTWSPGGDTTQSITVLTSGTYSVTVDSGGCPATSADVIVTVNPLPAPTITAGGPTTFCTGDSVVLTASGSSGNVWSPNAEITQSITVFAGGSYFVTETDGNGCINSSSTVVVTVNSLPPTPTITADGPTTFCIGNSVTLTSSSATGNLWSGGETTQSIIVNTSGSFDVTVTDGNGCSVISTSAVVTVNSLPVVDAGADVNITLGDSTTLSASGGVNYSWSPVTGLSDPNISDPVASPVATTTYTVTVTDGNGCTGMDSVTVSVTLPSPPVANFTATVLTIAPGDSVDFVDLSSNYPTLWSWTFTGGVPSSSTLQNPVDIRYDIVGCYEVILTASNTGGSDTETKTCYIDVQISNPVSCGINVTGCPGTTTPYTDGTGTGVLGNTTYPAPYGNWYWGARHQMLYTAAELQALGFTGGTISEIGFEIAAISGTTSYAGFEIKMGCTGLTSISTWQSGLTTVFPAQTITIAAGWNTHALTNAYDWDGTSNIIVEVCFNNASYTNNSATYYTTTGFTSVVYYYDDDIGICTNIGIIGTSANRPNIRFTTCSGGTGCPVITVAAPGVDPSCNNYTDGSATATASGGASPYTYLWSDGQTTSTATGFPGGTYAVTVTDNNGCDAVGIVVLTDPPPVSYTISYNNPTSCGGSPDGDATVTASGSPGIVMVDDFDPSIDGLMWSAYTGIASTSCGSVSGNAMYFNTTGSREAETIDVDVTFGGTVDFYIEFGSGAAPCELADAGEDVVLEYSTDGGSSWTLINTYDVAVYTVFTSISENIPAGAQTASTRFQWRQLLNSGVDFDNWAIDDVSITGNGGTFTYLWSDGQTTTTATGLNAGTYSVTITDGNGCTAADSVTLIAPGAPLASATSIDPICGSNNGQASVSVTGGTAPYTYNWSGGETTDTVTGLTAGTYDVTVTDNTGCTDSVSVTLIDISPSVSVSGNNTSCKGSSDGTATATVTGGITPYTYLWDDGQTTSTATGLVAGSYSVTITDDNSCTDTMSVAINEPSAVASTILTNDVSCFGGSDGSATVNASGGTPGYTYLWSSGGTDTTETGLTAGTYNVAVSDNNGCTDSSTVIITEPSAVSAGIMSSTIPSCFGGSDGSATAIGSGGTPGYGYSWSTGDSTATASGLITGTYTVTVTDSKGCTDTISVSITEPTAISLTSSTTDASCNLSDGTATVIASGGTPGYTYLWSSGGAGATETGLAMGFYTVLVTDANTCTQTDTVTVTEVGGLTAIISSSADVTCYGYTDGTATANVTGGTPGFTYNWSSGGTLLTETGLLPGTYTFTAIDTLGCIASDSVTINEPPAVPASITGNTTICDGDSTTLTGNGGVSYLWNTGDNTKSITINPNSDTTYSVIVTDSVGCTNTDSVLVTVNPLPATPTITAGGPTTFCAGGNVTLTSSSATGNLWSPTGDTIQSIIADTSGSFTVKTTDGNGCSATSAATIVTENPLPPTPVITASGTTTLCAGDSVTLTSSSATGNVWSPGGDTTLSINVNSAGSYTVTVTDGNGCSDVSSATTVVVNPLPTASIAGVTIICEGDSTTLTASGGTTYAWDTGDSTASISVSPVSVYSYSVTVTDGNGCSDNATTTVTVNPLPTPTITAGGPTTFCTGGSVILTSGSATGNVWSPGGETVQSVTVTVSGSYTVAVTDTNGCIGTSPATTVTVNQATASITGINTICEGSSTTLTASGGVSYIWNTSDNTSVITVSPIITTDYTVTVTDVDGCTDSATVTVTVYPLPTVSITGNTTICEGSLTALTATGGVSYLWSTGATTGTITVNPVSTTSYDVTVTDGNGCTNTETVSVIVNPNPVATITGNTTICEGESTTLLANGGTTYMWSTGETTSMITVSPTSTTPYSVTVTDVNGCTDSEMSTVTVDPLPQAAFNYSSSGATINFNNLSTDATSYQWFFGDGSSDITNNPEHTYANDGNYTVMLVAFNACGTDTFIQDIPVVIPGVEEEELAGSLQIYPNPTRGEFTLEMNVPQIQDIQLKIINIIGEEIFSEELSQVKGDYRRNFDLKKLPSGIYSLQVISEGNVIIRKLIIQ
ncbi:MAG: CUB domain-containing protein [Bacteroidota bacterium]